MSQEHAQTLKIPAGTGLVPNRLHVNDDAQWERYFSDHNAPIGALLWCEGERSHRIEELIGRLIQLENDDQTPWSGPIGIWVGPQYETYSRGHLVHSLIYFFSTHRWVLQSEVYVTCTMGLGLLLTFVPGVYSSKPESRTSLANVNDLSQARQYASSWFMSQLKLSPSNGMLFGYDWAPCALSRTWLTSHQAPEVLVDFSHQ